MKDISSMSLSLLFYMPWHRCFGNVSLKYGNPSNPSMNLSSLLDNNHLKWPGSILGTFGPLWSWYLIVVWPILWTIVVGSRVSITISWVLLFLGVHRHEVCHILGFLSLPLTAEADRGSGEQQGGDKSPANTNPRDEIRPVVWYWCVIPQQLIPGHLVWVCSQFLLFKVFTSVPQSHTTGGE